jgi:membrane protein implicated in regulation of membrane protease activity
VEAEDRARKAVEWTVITNVMFLLATASATLIIGLTPLIWALWVAWAALCGVAVWSLVRFARFDRSP